MIKTKLPPRTVVIETLVMIYRYAYYVELTKLVSDNFYDRLEIEAVKLLPKNSPVHKPGSALLADYKDYTITMAKKAMQDEHFLDNLLEKVGEI